MKEKKRNQVAERLTYECRSLVFENGRCSCAHGKRLSMAPDGSIGAELILRGMTPFICKKCRLFSSVVSLN